MLSSQRGFARHRDVILLPSVIVLLLVRCVVQSFSFLPPTILASNSRNHRLLSFQHDYHQDDVALFSTLTPPDSRYYTPLEELPVPGGKSSDQPRITLNRYLNMLVKENPQMYDLEPLALAIQMACKTISTLVHRAGLSYSIQRQQQQQHTDDDDDDEKNEFTDGRFYSMERLDSLSTIVCRNALKYTGKCEIVEPNKEKDERQPGVLVAKCYDSKYVACIDPLDGSGNADASICTGTVFGIFEGTKEEDDNESDAASGTEARLEQLVRSVLQPGKNMRAAGYCLYSSATVLVFTLGEGSGVQGFTLDPQINEFVLTHPDLTIPSRGSVYSCNEANSEGWAEGFKTYLRNLKMGKGETGQRYALRYVGSMVGDIHRTLLYGGIFSYPSDTLTHPDGNLQLLYKSAPMAFVVHHAGGRAIDGRTGNLLDVRPERVHQKSPCFIGSPDDVNELERYL